MEKEPTLEQLKAGAYDIGTQINILQNQLQQYNQEIARRINGTTPPTEKPTGSGVDEKPKEDKKAKD